MLVGLLGENDAPSALERQITEILEAIHADPSKAEHFVKLLPLANQYVLLHPDVATNVAIPAEDARFKPHQFCKKSATVRPLEDPAREAEQRFRCLIQVCMLRVLSFKVKRLIQVWLQGLAKTIFECVDCYKEYLRAKRRLAPDFLHTYDDERIEHFLNHILEWEERAALPFIENSNVSGDSSKLPLSIDQTFILFDLAGVLEAAGRTETLYDKMRRGRKHLALNKIPEAPTGLLAFAIDDEEPVRSWAEMQWAVPPMSREASTEGKAMARLVQQAIVRQQWSGYAFLVKMAPEAFTGTSLLSTLLSHLSPRLNDTVSVLKCFQQLLRAQGLALWAHEDREFPLVILSYILDNQSFIQCAADNVDRKDIWSWVNVFIASLKDRLLSTSEKPQAAEADAKVYEEAVKRLAHFLLERFQQGSHADTAKSQASHQAIALLDSCVSSANEPMLSTYLWPAIVRIVALHSAAIVRIAFATSKANPESSNHAFVVSPAESAQKLAVTIFEHDCAVFSDHLLSLSEITSASQVAYRRAIKARVKEDGTKDTDEDTMTKEVIDVFEKVKNRLDSNVLVCSELWKDAYNARRASAFVQIFLRPLARISALVEPQINSHIVLVKERHESLPAYLQYKERVKATILSLSRRLSTMRGNLPSLLLEASEANGTQSSQHYAGDPTLICYKYADCIIAASLCPQQDVHKAAQNIVRAAFEDAESRGDCFRSLLSCNPETAFRGINDFLESFITAATKLVEANDAAKWMVRSFSDVLEAMCSDSDGLLRQGTPGNLLDRTAITLQLSKEIQRMWTSMNKSIAVIFKRTPHWARVLPHAELTAWFRDVSLFARQAIAEVRVFQNAVARNGQDTSDKGSQIRLDMLVDLALPLEQASSWLRMNNAEIVEETREYFTRGLLTFKSENIPFPEGATKRMLDFIDTQSKITKDEQRMTLLSLNELDDLRHLLAPDLDTVEISDSEDEDVEAIDISHKKERGENIPASSTRKYKEEQQPAKGDAFAFMLKASRLADAEKGRAKQSKLGFSSVDSAEALKRPFSSKAVPTPPQPRPAGTTGASNKYQGASARVTVPPRPSSKLAQLRQDFQSNSTYRPPLPTYRGARELPEPAAPEAKRSFDFGGQVVVSDKTADKEVVKQQQSSDESDSSEDEQKVGLADMGVKKKSPVKMRNRTRFVPHPVQQRRTIMLDDIEARRVQRERDEAERKRKLREPVNFNPLHRVILSWRYWADGQRPPSGPDQPETQYETVRPSYKDPAEYERIFGPMLLLELWAELQAAKEQIKRGNPDFAPLTATVNGRASTDGFVILTLSLAEDRRLLGRSPLQDTDVVFVRTPTKGPDGKQRTVLGKVQAFKSDPKGARLTLRCKLNNDDQQMTSVLVTNAIVEVGKLFSLTTLHRAYEALQVVGYFDLLPNILLARTAVLEKIAPSQLREVEESFEVNKPQAEAILSAINADQGFHLIQGPPGTGKTKTIASLVVHFMRTRKAPAMPIRMGESGAPHLNGVPIKQKILLCAPSNAAVDEVARRVQAAVKLADGRVIRPNVVRVGREEAISAAVKEISLDSIVQRRIGTGSSFDHGIVDPSQLHQEIRDLREQRDLKRSEIEVARHEGKNDTIIAQLEAEFRNLTSRRMDVMSKLDEVKDKRQTITRQYDADRKRVQQEILLQADVVCATLGGAGHPTLSSLPLDFETVIIDEAAQAVELDALIPLRYGCKKCIMVGDPNQLPPTVISREAERLKYSQSLFVRLFNNPSSHSHLLSIQYRMHPHISTFPNKAFYQGRLQDGPAMADLTARPWHKDNLLKPLRFIDCRGGNENVGRGGLSFTNKAEAELAAAIYERLHREARRSQLGSQAVEGKIGVVTMYKEQVFELRRTFQRFFGSNIVDAVDFNTVDGFQGQEKDIIILSCVRTSGIGFLNDFRRINVAVTRAKANLFVIAHVSNLERHDRDGFWRQSLDAARRDGDLVSADAQVYRRKSMSLENGPLPPPSRGNGSSSALGSLNTDESSRLRADGPHKGEKRFHPEKSGDQHEGRKPKKSRKMDLEPLEKESINLPKVHNDEGGSSLSDRPAGRSDKQSTTKSVVAPSASSADQSRLSPSTKSATSTQRPPATRIAIPGEIENSASSKAHRRLYPRPSMPASDRNSLSTLNPRATAASRPPARPRPPGQRPEPHRQGNEGPSDRAKASLFMPKRPPGPRPPRPLR